MAEVVAVDGPSASGKSTVARHVARELGFLYVDSGAMYRGLTWKALRERVDPSDPAAVVRLLPRIAAETYVIEGSVRFRLDGTDPLRELRERDVTESVSLVAAIPEVRTRVNAWLREALRFGSLVIEGRDIGTAVFPTASFKFYLDATPEERARRRLAELSGPAGAATVGEVEQSLKRRDTIDSGRRTDPLRVAPDAVAIDSTRLSIDQVVRLIVDRVMGRGA
jgi:CMP/dCMP kinase